MLLLRQTFTCFLLLTLLTGVAYPLAITAVARLCFAAQAGGSLVEQHGRPVGSALIGQPFSGAGYFWPRPSATQPLPYAADNSAGSNLGPLNPALLERVQEQAARLRQAHPDPPGPIPVDLLTCSASGLDPHISPAAAEYQVRRVAQARGLDENQLRRLVAEHTQQRQLGFLGEPRVNVLLLNLALDRLGGRVE